MSSLHCALTEQLERLTKRASHLHVFALFGGDADHLSETEGSVRSPRASKPRAQTERKQRGSAAARLRKETNKVLFEHEIRLKHGYGS